jgi:hypothetical protein
MGCPCSSLLWFFVEYYTSPWWCHWCAVKVEGAIELGVCQQFWVDARLSEEVQRDDRVGDESIPKVKWKLFVC